MLHNPAGENNQSRFPSQCRLGFEQCNYNPHFWGTCLEIADSSAYCFPLRHNLFKLISITYDCTPKSRNVELKLGIFSL